MIAREEIAFEKYPSLLELEKRHGVSIGRTYATEHKCKKFTIFVGETMRDDVLEQIRKSPYRSVLMDGSTDNSVIEKELIYVMFIGAVDKVECQFFRLKRRS